MRQPRHGFLFAVMVRPFGICLLLLLSEPHAPQPAVCGHLFAFQAVCSFGMASTRMKPVGPDIRLPSKLPHAARWNTKARRRPEVERVCIYSDFFFFCSLFLLYLWFGPRCGRRAREKRNKVKGLPRGPRQARETVHDAICAANMVRLVSLSCTWSNEERDILRRSAYQWLFEGLIGMCDMWHACPFSFTPPSLRNAPRASVCVHVSLNVPDSSVMPRGQFRVLLFFIFIFIFCIVLGMAGSCPAAVGKTRA